MKRDDSYPSSRSESLEASEARGPWTEVGAVVEEASEEAGGGV